MLTFQQFMLRQPTFPDESKTDRYYYELTLKLVDIWNKSGLFADCEQALRERVALCIVGYFQDISVDAGLWHSFIKECRHLYGRTLPFYDVTDAYLDCELNLEDLRFLVWYAIAMLDLEKRMLNPLEPEIEKLALKFYTHLDAIYEEAPMPVDYRLNHELEMHDPEDQPTIFALSHWLFMNSYLLTPAFALSLSEIVNDPEVQADPDHIVLQERMEQAMSQLPTGPLALFLNEWTYLIVDHKYPPKKAETPGIHPYWEKFTAYTHGEEVKIFATYEEMNRFFIDALGWTEGEEHLVQMKGAKNYVLLVNKHKGMLLARNVAECINMPGNQLYDPEYARQNAIKLFTVRGFCPYDLVRYAVDKGWITDAQFPKGPDSGKLVADNHDFIARCYLQLYYRD